jgi:DUF4097 and DUF4098 domain-containing protein YvlB
MKLATLFIAISIPLAAQTIAFSDDARPRLFKAEILNGRITVQAYAGKDAIITEENPTPDSKNNISLTEQNNVITLSGGVRRNANLTIQVPRQTSLQLRCANCGELLVEGVEGDIDVNTVNGGIRLNNVSGSVLAHSLNNKITATIDGVDPGKAMSFSSLNGSIDCTFPASLKANVKMRTTNGKIYTDFEIRLAGGETIRMDRGISGTINGGGPEISFKAFNGSINIRRKSP